MRVFSEDCQLDAGGRTVIWLDGVRPAESVALLESLARAADGRRDRITDGAITAIALHDDAAADARSNGWSRPASRRRSAEGHVLAGELARRAGPRDAAAGHQGRSVQEVKKKAVFGVSQSREAGVSTSLI